VRDVPVAAEHDFAAFGAQTFEVREEASHERELDALALLTAGTRRLVDRNHREVPEIQADVASLVIDVRDADAFGHFGRLVARVDADPAVAPFLRAMEIPLQAPGAFDFPRHVAGLCLELLHADDVGTASAEPREEALTGG
jgi:hypothetical protein